MKNIKIIFSMPEKLVYEEGVHNKIYYDQDF